MKSLIEKLRAMEIDSDLKLDYTHPLDEFEDKEMKNTLKLFYNHKNSHVKKIGSILNALFYQPRKIFIITKKLLNSLVKYDVNIKANSVDSEAYGKALYHMFNNNIIKRIREPAQNKAGLYKIIDRDILTIMEKNAGKAFLDAQEEKGVEYYDKFQVGEDDPIVSKAMEKVNERKAKYNKRSN